MDLSYFDLKKNPFSYDADPESSNGDMNGDANNGSNGDKLTEKETGAYIRRCLRTAGTTEQIFYASAIRKVFSYSNGDTKLTDKICYLALKNAYDKGKKVVDSEIVNDCIEEYLSSDQTGEVNEEKRRHNRIKTDIQGSYFLSANKERGILTVTNMSLSGIQIKLTKQRILKVGDRVIIAFSLDNERQTEIREMMIVKNIIGFFAGMAFNAQPDTDAFAEYLKQKS